MLHATVGTKTYFHTYNFTYNTKFYNLPGNNYHINDTELYCQSILKLKNSIIIKKCL